MSRGLKAALSLAVLVGLVACGGGGGGGATGGSQAFSVGGSVSGLAQGSQVVLLNNGGDALTLSANGNFTFATSVAYSGSYVVTVGTQPTGRACTVAQGSGAGVVANVANVQVNCLPLTYSVGGSLQGLANGGQVTLLNNGAEPLTLNANGSFAFATAVPYLGNYAVTVGTQPAGQTCSVLNGTASGVAANVSGVTVSCVDSCVTTLSGVLSSNATYATSGSPYCISGSLQVPGGVAVVFDPGTSVSGGRLVVQGSLSVNGTAAARVRMTDVDVVPAGQQAANHNITIAFADISRGSLYAPTGNAIYGSLTITDSRISNLGSYLYLWYPLGVNTIARNVFVGSGGISYGLDFRNAPGLSLSIVSNYFSSWTSGAAVQNWAQYGTGAAVVEGNTFASTSLVAVMLPGGYTNAAMDASNNYWGTTDMAVIEQMIYDKRVDVTSAGYVTYTPFLSSPAASTPTP